MSPEIKQKIMSALTQETIAKKIGCRQQTISLWLNKGVPDGKVLVFSEALGWVATPHDLRPDLYPHPCDGLPRAMRHEPRKNKRTSPKEA